MGVTAADYDGDGAPDLYLTAWGPDQFYRREADGYVDATEEVGLGHAGWTTSAVAFDYDLDGDLDLFRRAIRPLCLGGAALVWTRGHGAALLLRSEGL